MDGRMISVGWSDFKNFVVARSLPCQYVLANDTYYIQAFDGQFALSCELYKMGTPSADQADFETNFIPLANKVLVPKDSDGSIIQRPKTTKTGWHFEPHSMDFYTAKHKSLYNRKYDGAQILDGTDIGDCVISFFDTSGNQLVQNEGELDAAFQIRLAANCCKTYCDWEPVYAFDLVGGYFQILNPPPYTAPAYLWIIIAPDVPEYLGGSVPFCNGGWNLAFFSSANVPFDVDGKGVKSFVYDPVYHSGKIRMIIKHAVGVQIGIQIIYKQYRG